MWAERWRSATGSEAGPDFQPIFDGFSFEKEKMLSWFSGEPRFFAMFTEWTAKGPYVYRMAGKDYSFAEVPFDVGAHFVRKGDYGEAYDYLLRAHEADPGLRPAARMLAEVCRKTGRLDEALRVEEKLGGAP